GLGPTPSTLNMKRLVALHVLGALLLATASVSAQPPPAPPYPPRYQAPTPPPGYYPYAPPPVAYGPPRMVDPTPPPLSPVMRAIYAPFYVTGLVLRYGAYYLLVAPLEVLGRTISYGAQGGVEHPQPQAPPPNALPPDQGAPPPGDQGGPPP